MLKIEIPESDLWDEKTETFVKIKHTILQLEHSLVSISKWESKWHIPFLGKKEMTPEMTLDYIKCMTLTQNVNPIVYNFIPESELKKVNDYISDPMTATTFNDKNSKKNREIITSEVFYYMMFANQIPKECEKWHLNRLITLLHVFSIKNEPPKKMSKKETAKSYAALNAKRRAAMHSKG